MNKTEQETSFSEKTIKFTPHIVYTFFGTFKDDTYFPSTRIYRPYRGRATIAKLNRISAVGVDADALANSDFLSNIQSGRGISAILLTVVRDG